MAKASVFEKVELPSLSWQWRTWEEIQSSSWFTKINWINMAMLLSILVVAIYQARSKMEAAKKAGFEQRFLKAPTFPQPEEQLNFDHTKTEPLQLRPFKPKYHLTMALENLDPSDLLLMDRNHGERIKYRSSIIQKHTTNVVNVHDDERIAPAVHEYYTYIMGTYLPLRYPAMFKLHETDYETGKTYMLENKVNGALRPAFPISPGMTTKMLLESLGRTIDDDILFLLPEQTDPEKPSEAKYVLHAFCVCCPSGFNTREKLGLRLASIHDPVPGYKDKLESSMDRFFNKLEVGKYVKRVNWSITTHGELYAAPEAGMGTHAHEGDELEEMPEIDGDKTFLRVERQTLHRLPTSKAIVFSFKTYLYPLSAIKAEGHTELSGEVSSAEALAQAIDGLREGNVQGMWFYKRGAVWGEAVKKYLRS